VATGVTRNNSGGGIVEYFGGIIRVCLAPGESSGKSLATSKYWKDWKTKLFPKDATNVSGRHPAPPCLLLGEYFNERFTKGSENQQGYAT